VLELLAARINVITALNIEYVQSLAPMMKHLTGVTVHKMVADAFLAHADEIVEVDISIADLHERLRRASVRPERGRR
jgi:two-component system, OmpR family, sensor histidine kinase KdpD